MKLEINCKPNPFDPRKQLQHLEAGEVFEYKDTKYIRAETNNYSSGIYAMCMEHFDIQLLQKDVLVEPLKADMNIYENPKA